MRVKLLSARVSGLVAHEPGAVLDLPEAEAKALIAGLSAEPVETAARRPPETAARRVKRNEEG